MLEKYSIKTSFSQSLLQKKSSGFLLIEIMASLMMLIISMSVISYFCFHIAALHYDARMYNNAISLSADIAEKIKEEGNVNVLKKQHNDFLIHAAAISSKPENISSHYVQNLKNFKDIEIRVSWKTLADKVQQYRIATCCELKT